MGATDAFIAQLVAYARYSGSQWPYVTMPSFAIHATKLLKLSKAFQFAVYPFVEPYQKQEWEAYAEANSGWVNESLAIQARDSEWYGANEEGEFEKTYAIFSSRPNSSSPFEYM